MNVFNASQPHKRRRAPDCHHSVRESHRCHFGNCPPCRQPCNKPRDTCSHLCVARCHSAVWHRPATQSQRAGPWEAPHTPQLVSILCPPCSVLVPVSCLGNHETVATACSEAQSTSCSRACGRRLACYKHFCQLDCHPVTDAPDNTSAGLECEVCESPCLEPRPAGCTHICQLGVCHVGQCPPCRQMIRMRCYCQLVVLHIDCSSWTSADLTQRCTMQSCGGSCPKYLSCGHTCGEVCHAGDCASTKASLCRAKVKVKCTCGRRRVNYVCSDVLTGRVSVVCDDECHAHVTRLAQERTQREATERDVQLDRQKVELEAFERKSMGRRRRQRRNDRDVLVQSTSVLGRRCGQPLITSAVVIGVLAAFIYWLLTTN